MVAAAKETPHLRTIVSMNSVSQEAREKAKEAEIDLITFQECEVGIVLEIFSLISIFYVLKI